jgi:spoIIIJ-associated protein
MTINKYLKKLTLFSGLKEENIEIEIEKTEERVEIKLTVPEEKASLFIGTRGETLYAIQHMVRLVFRKKYSEKRIVLDINNYRQEKEDKLIAKAKRAADQVLETGETEVLTNLNSYERYLVHTAIAEDENLGEVTTESYDEVDQRVLTIKLKEQENES